MSCSFRLTVWVRRTYVRFVDRWHELENRRRALAMLPPEASALKREEAMRLLQELQTTERRLRRLRDGLSALLEEDGPGG
jgi:hypothetical protein